MRIHTAQPESMGSSIVGSLTLVPMGQKGGGSALWLVISLIFHLSAYSKRVSCLEQCQEAYQIDISFKVLKFSCVKGPYV